MLLVHKTVAFILLVALPLMNTFGKDKVHAYHGKSVMDLIRVLSVLKMSSWCSGMACLLLFLII